MRFIIAILVLSLFSASPVSAVEVPSCELMTGKPYKTPILRTVYYISKDCKKYSIPNEAFYFSYFDSWKHVRIASPARLKKVPNAGTKLPLGPRVMPLLQERPIAEPAKPIVLVTDAERRDGQRLKDVRQIQTALELHFVDNNQYPLQEGKLGSGNFSCLNISGWAGPGCSTPYMGRVPVAPEPFPYEYQSMLDGDEYCVVTSLEVGVGELVKGAIVATPRGIRNVADGENTVCPPKQTPPTSVELREKEDRAL